MEAVCDAVFELTESSATAAHWSRAAYRVYWPTEMESAAMQAKVLLVCCLREYDSGGNSSDFAWNTQMPQRSGFVGFAAFFCDHEHWHGGSAPWENMTVAEPWRRQGKLVRACYLPGC